MNTDAQSKQQETAATETNQFTPDFQIAKLSAIGILGFIIGCVFLFYDDLGSLFKTNTVFHEVEYQPRVYAQTLVDYTVDSLGKDTSRLVKDTSILQSELKTLNNTKETETEKKAALTKSIAALNEFFKYKKDTLAAAKAYIAKLLSYRKYYEDLAIVDTVSFSELNKALHFQETPDLLNRWDCLFGKQKFTKNPCTSQVDKDKCCLQISTKVSLGTVDCYLKDKELPFKISGKVDFKAVKPDSDIEFISKYPTAGIWLILVLIFCSFCFTAIATAVYMKGKAGEIFTENEKKKLSGKYYLLCLIIFLVMVVVAFIWYFTFYDDDIVKNLFFFKHLDISMGLVIALGSVAGAFCLAGFIYTASMVKYFAKPFVQLSKDSELLKNEIEKLKADTQLALANQQTITDKQMQLEDKNAALAESEKNFKRLTGLFQNYFLLAAVILSIMVLCTGALFTTVNSLDFVKMLASDWGYSPVRSDYVYLYGGLYTIILLLVYIPAKMRFSEVDADVWSNKPKTDPGTSKWYDFLKDPFGKMKDVLVATSPFLISIIQSLLDTLFK